MSRRGESGEITADTTSELVAHRPARYLDAGGTNAAAHPTALAG